MNFEKCHHSIIVLVPYYYNGAVGESRRRFAEAEVTNTSNIINMYGALRREEGAHLGTFRAKTTFPTQIMLLGFPISQLSVCSADISSTSGAYF